MLEEEVGILLKKHKKILAAAESCTGGLIADRITDIPGSSNYFGTGIVAYSNETKMKILHVPKDILETFGAVSAETAKAMAEGVRDLAKADIAVSTTGIAGPTGAAPKKPIGLVYVGLSTPEGTKTKEFNFKGNRLEIKRKASEEALRMVRDYLENI